MIIAALICCGVLLDGTLLRMLNETGLAGLLDVIVNDNGCKAIKKDLQLPAISIMDTF